MRATADNPTERSPAWRAGFERAETDWYFATADGVVSLENPYQSGSDEHAGYEAAAYISTQK